MKRKGLVVRRVAVIGAVILVVLVAAFAWYVNDYYRADESAYAALTQTGDGVEVRELDGGAIAFVPAQAHSGLVFYPGAKVQPEAYAPLMRRCAERGVACVIVKPLFNLAILSVDAAQGVPGQLPEVHSWYLAGHSMGGVAASSYLANHEGDFGGIVFLASYPAEDLAGFGGDALSIVGSADGVLNRDNFDAARSKMPRSAAVETIEGGNHANFGDYGVQAGDGEATISREEQQRKTADLVANLMQAA